MEAKQLSTKTATETEEKYGKVLLEDRPEKYITSKVNYLVQRGTNIAKFHASVKLSLSMDVLAMRSMQNIARRRSN